MSRRAPHEHTVHELIAARWSPCGFADRAVAVSELRSLFEAARWAPSSFNEQPWRYVVATRDDAAGFSKLLEVLVEANQEWARRAPVLVLAIAMSKFTRNGRDNRHAWHDLGAATACLTVEATARGLAVHQMAGFDHARAREAFRIPDQADPVAVFALGYPSLEGLPDHLARRDAAPRQRTPLSESVFCGAFGHPAPWTTQEALP